MSRSFLPSSLMASTLSRCLLVLLTFTTITYAQTDNATTYFSVPFISQELNVTFPLLADIASQSTAAPAPSTNGSLLLTCPRGSAVPSPAPTIYDDAGNVIWIGQQWGECFDLNNQWYNGTLVMSVWVGDIQAGGWGSGTVVLLDSSYTNIKNVTAISPNGADIHEFNIIAQNQNTTAVLTSYVPVGPMDLTPFAGPNPGWVLDSWFQEIDIPTGNLIFNWSALEHMNLNESFSAPGTTGNSADNAWDAFHVNSIDKDANGDYLISSRHFHQLLKINHTDGSVLWRMGGFSNNFNRSAGTNFEWQHDARWQASGTHISVFDNAASNFAVNESSARGLYLAVDQNALSVTLEQQFLPVGYTNYSQSQGNVQLLPNGNFLIGWGSNPYVSEYLSNGTAIFGAKIGPVDAPGDPQAAIQNYRAFKTTDWVGRPNTPPVMALKNSSDGVLTYVSWNGATQVHTYSVLGSSSPDTSSFAPVQNTSKNAFETLISLNSSSSPTIPAYVAVVALASDGSELGRTGILRVSDGVLVSNGSVVAPPSPSSSGDTKPNGAARLAQSNTLWTLTVVVILVGIMVESLS